MNIRLISSLRPLILILLQGLLALTFTAQALAQDGSAAQETDGLTRSSKTVSISQAPGDLAVSQRIERILLVTGWFENLKVEVREGVVSLHGIVDKKSHSEWAESLAHDTDGVVAVNNELTVPTAGWFDLKPARAETEELFKRTMAFMPYLLTGFVIMALFLFLASLASKLGRRAAQRKVHNALLVEILAKLAALPVIIIGLYLVLQMAGLTGMAVTILGGTGALGLIVGFALKNILENYFSGVMLSLRNPYNVGDTVEINGKKGVVQKLTTRGTILVDFDGNHIIIPNSTIYAGMIINSTANPSTRVKFMISVGYDTNIADLRASILEVLKDNSEVLQTPMPLVMVQNFASSGIELQILFWIDSAKSSVMKMQSKIMECVKVRLQNDGVEFPAVSVNVWTTPGAAERRAAKAPVKKAQTVDESSATHNEAHGLLAQARQGRDIDHGDELIAGSPP